MRRIAVALGLAITVAMMTIPAALAAQPSAHAAASISTCGSRELVGFYAGGGAAAGNDASNIGIVNVGTSTCRLAGYPGIIGIRDGHEFRLRGVAHGTFFGNLEPTVLAPRMTGALVLGTETACVAVNRPGPGPTAYLAAHSYVGLVIVLPDHTGYVRVPSVQFENGCTLYETRLGWRSGLNL
jgi:hypothetical protein